MPKIDENQTKKEEVSVNIDPTQPYEFKFKILAEYMDLYNKLKRENPELLENEIKRVKIVKT
jgi:hypothetical protein